MNDDLTDALLGMLLKGNEAGQEEASALTRTMTRFVRDIYVGMVAEGFTEAQALRFTATFIAEAVSKSGDDS